MKRVFLLLILLLISLDLFADNRVRIVVKKDKIEAIIDIPENEHIVLNEMFLYLFIESDEYEFVFHGYPEGEDSDYGFTVYSDRLILSGDLFLKPGVEPGIYPVNVVVGYQSCDDEGLCFIPVEIAENIAFGERGNQSIHNILGLLFSLIVILIIIIGIRKRRG